MTTMTTETSDWSQAKGGEIKARIFDIGDGDFLLVVRDMIEGDYMYEMGNREYFVEMALGLGNCSEEARNTDCYVGHEFPDFGALGPATTLHLCPDYALWLASVILKAVDPIPDWARIGA